MVKVENDKCFTISAPFSLSIMDIFFKSVCILANSFSAQQIDALFLSTFSFCQQYSGRSYVENTQTFQALSNTSVANISYPGHLKDL